MPIAHPPGNDTSTRPKRASNGPKTKIDAQKIKDSSIKIKLDIAKLQNDILKHGGNEEKAINEHSDGKANLSDFNTIRDIIKNNSDSEDTNEDSNA